MISQGSMKAVLRHKNKTYTNLFKIRHDDSRFVILGKGGVAIQEMDSRFHFQCKQELLILLFNIQFLATKNGRVKEILLKDSKYRKTIDEMIWMLKIKE
jgi:hypothetical protein